MPQAKEVKNIVIHCSAGFGNVQSIKKYWSEVLGWKSVGYHLIVDLNGVINRLAEFSSMTNGVASNNSHTIHICYIGGVEIAGKNLKTGQVIYKGKDTRTPAQKYAIEKSIIMVKNWLSENGKDVSKDLGIVGHRDYSPDQDGNGIIAPWERIKECPSFDALTEYAAYASDDRVGMLPNAIKPTFDNTIIYVVLPGDTLSKIASKYKTTVNNIKNKNSLTNDLIKVGQKLKITYI